MPPHSQDAPLLRHTMPHHPSNEFFSSACMLVGAAGKFLLFDGNR